MGPRARAREQGKAGSIVPHPKWLSQEVSPALQDAKPCQCSHRHLENRDKAWSRGWQEWGWQHPAGVGIHTHCSSAVPAFEGVNLPSGLLNFQQGILPLFPSLFLCFPLVQTPPLCCRGSSPLSKFNPLHHWCFPRAAVPSPGAFGRRKQSTSETGGCWLQPLHPCALHASLRKTLRLRFFKRFRGISRSNSY